MIIQQPASVQPLPGEVQRRLGDVAAATMRAPRVELLLARQRAAAGRRHADTPEVVVVQVGHGARATVAHCHDLSIEHVVDLRHPTGDLLPHALQVDRGRAAVHDLDPLAVGVVAVVLTAGGVADGRRQVLSVPGVRAPRAAGEIAVGVVDVGDTADGGGGVRAGAAGCRVGIGDARLVRQVTDRVIAVGLRGSGIRRARQAVAPSLLEDGRGYREPTPAAMITWGGEPPLQRSNEPRGQYRRQLGARCRSSGSSRAPIQWLRSLTGAVRRCRARYDLAR